MSRFTVTQLPLLGLKLIERTCLFDDRGFFSRLFCASDLEAASWIQPISQINHSYTAKRGTVRGLHFQRLPHTEMKLVSCIRGVVWDVTVDLRVGSPTYLSWHAEQLSAETGRSMLIPEGFAHGFQALTDDVELLYFHSAAYTPQAEGGLNPVDQRLAIDWPLPPSGLSPRDANIPMLTDGFEGFRL